MASTPRDSGEALRKEVTLAIRKTWVHLAMSIAICSATAIWCVVQGVPRSGIAFSAAIAALLLTYDLSRITRARAALASTALLREFAKGQQASSRIRGRVYIILAPIVTTLMWWRVLTAHDNEAASLVVLA